MVRHSAISRARRRREQRGAALFVVLLVITLLMGIGAFAARSSHLAVAASGSDKKMTQARYVAEYGLMFAAAKLSNSGAQSYLKQMRNPPNTDVCYGQNAATPQRSCYRMFSSSIAGELAPDFKICDSASGTTPGSFGLANAECAFSVELSDLSEGMVLPGFDLGGGKALRFWYVTATAIGQVRIANTGGNAALDATSAESSVTATLRSRILTGPFPSN